VLLEKLSNHAQDIIKDKMSHHKTVKNMEAYFEKIIAQT
jgi:hypothetical protein